MAMFTIGATQGMGERESTLPLGNIEKIILYGWVSQFLILIGIGLAKVAIVLFLLRIQGYYEPFKAILLWFIVGSNLTINFVAAMLIIFQCSPVQKLWDDRIPGICPGREWTQKFGYFQGCKCPFHVNTDGTRAAPYLHLRLSLAWSCFCDLALAVYPIFIFWRVQAFSIKTKIGLCALLGIGVM